MVSTNEVVLYMMTLFQFFTVTSASVGDRSWIFFRCMDKCLIKKCSNMTKFNSKQPFYHHILRWNCEDECKYQCMWKTVDAFKKDGSNVPQFFGKWPFVRLWGIQEPASMFFSVLNLLCHFLVLKFHKNVPSSAPLYYVWHGGALVGANAWFWSIVFHTRDTDFTEKMDYFCAFSIAMYSFFGMCCRFLGTDRVWKPTVVGAVIMIYYTFHVYYLGWVKFDYSYNMKANIFVGTLVLLGWLVWCAVSRRTNQYAWKCVLFIVLMNVFLLLELGDFPPLLWTFDAHSLWHAGTSPLGVLWYSFITDDCLYLDKKRKEEQLPSFSNTQSKKVT